MPLRIVFMGTPDFSVPTLAEIVGARHDVAAVYSQPPRPAGRGMEPRKSPVHTWAEAAGLPVFTPISLKSAEEHERMASFAADVAVVVAYGLLLPQAVLDAPRQGCLNLHASALPRWRGAAPIQRAIMAGDKETAVMVMQMEAGLDTGPICLAERVSIGVNETAGELHDRLSLTGASLMVRALAALERGSLRATPQAADGVTYARKIEKAEARIEFSRDAHDVHNAIRGLSPFPGAWLEVEVEGRRERLKVLRAEYVDQSGPAGAFLDANLTIACGRGAIRLIEVQRAGKKPMAAAEFLRGVALPKGAKALGAEATRSD